ncbi:MAG TPA: hypothetical protein VNE00_04460 [Paraburkholderia sp.]|jgi:hypothetical protein|nr:hypothetical protein [Paraburkholderia sp.]
MAQVTTHHLQFDNDALAAAQGAHEPPFALSVALLVVPLSEPFAGVTP